jgi:hypothetical protein
MAERYKPKQSNALKHGVYSTIGLLPGESPTEFKKNQQDVIDDLRPNGPVEHDIVLTIARLLWRKQNLITFQTAELVKSRFDEILEEELERRGFGSSQDEEPAARQEAERAAEKRARSELGECYKFMDDDFGTIDRLMMDLEIGERLDAIIDKCFRRLLMVRGVKSMALAPLSEPPQLHKPRDVSRPTA